MKRTEWILLA